MAKLRPVFSPTAESLSIYLYLFLFLSLSSSLLLSLNIYPSPPQVNRSTALLKSLSAERDRWEKTSETFKNQMSTIAGDCLLSAAFITYAGYFEQQMRQNLFTTWSHHLQQANIQVETTDGVNRTHLHHVSRQERCAKLPSAHCRSSSVLTLQELSTCPMLTSGSAGKPTPFQLMTSALRMPSCSRDSTGVYLSSLPK